MDAPLGEVYQSRYAYSSTPANARLNGQHVCGGPALTEGMPCADRPGLVLDVTGMPTCCQAAPPPPARLTLCGQGSTPQVYSAGIAFDAELDRPTDSAAIARFEHPIIWILRSGESAIALQYPIIWTCELCCGSRFIRDLFDGRV